MDGIHVENRIREFYNTDMESEPFCAILSTLMWRGGGKERKGEERRKWETCSSIQSKGFCYLFWNRKPDLEELFMPIFIPTCLSASDVIWWGIMMIMCMVIVTERVWMNIWYGNLMESNGIQQKDPPDDVEIEPIVSASFLSPIRLFISSPSVLIPHERQILSILLSLQIDVYCIIVKWMIH